MTVTTTVVVIIKTGQDTSLAVLETVVVATAQHRIDTRRVTATILNVSPQRILGRKNCDTKTLPSWEMKQ